MNKIEFGDCREIMKRWKDEGVKIQTCVTSPPYYGLRDYGHDDQIGNEQTPQKFINNLVEVFACVWDILSDDGTVWLNLGDSYANNSSQASNNGRAGFGNPREKVVNRIGNGYKQKDLMGMPWKVAFALQEFGWYLRQDIIWHKPNPMPESVTDRCTKSHEYIFLLTKNDKYYFDYEAIMEDSTDSYKGKRGQLKHRNKTESAMTDRVFNFEYSENAKRRKRDVWSVTVKPYKGAHFATYPKDLIEPCIKAGTSENGHCPECGARWKRIKIDTGQRHEVEVYTGKAVKDYELANVQNPSDTKRRILESMSKIYEFKFIPICKCELEPVPDIVFDPFMGSGTTALVAKELGRQYLGCELNKEYEKLQQERINNG